MAPVRVAVEDWLPNGITLEPAALQAAKSESNSLVVAGPGAGKTELLAQRACFLLQTGKCAAPHRILAISFKRDAAENLKRRVTLRCGRELASRFDSMTYDAFAKDLLDRFRGALPALYRPSAGFEPMTGPESYNNALREQFLSLTDEQCRLNQFERQSINSDFLVKVGLLGNSLPFQEWPRENVYRAGASLWKSLLNAHPAKLTFPMIGRLAELIVNTNPAIKRALQGTYQYVFLDEFQDTTNIQFDMTKACFLGSGSVLTAVGDNKQRIMVWAGALDAIFRQYLQGFSCSAPYVLSQNHRSRSVLVGVQSVFAKWLDSDALATEAAYGGADEGECRVIEFSDEQGEASGLADLIEETINEEGVPAHEICILCRARPDSFASVLHDELKSRGVRVYVDVSRRDVLAEPVAQLLLDILSLLGDVSSPAAWDNVCALLSEVEGDRDDDQKKARTMVRLCGHLENLRRARPNTDCDEDAVRSFLDECLTFIGKDRFSVLYPQYVKGGYMDSVIGKLAELIFAELSECGWVGLPDIVRGIGSVSIMTMHKSKGLEFHTVIFLGLEDGALWNFNRNSDEETCGLFVALSRAKERCIFTFSSVRVGRYDRTERQSRASIRKIYELFEEAGVEVEVLP